VKPGPQIDRQFSAPIGGPTALTDPVIFEKRSGRVSAPAEPAGDPNTGHD
jgi:NADH-quinone oxidoreductase subunit E